MDPVFYVFVAALTVIVVCSVTAPKYPKGGNTRNQLYLISGVAVVVLSVCVLIGLWEAWSPWTFQERQ